MAIEVRWGAATHQGHVRETNQDALLAGPTVFAVADGMGGHAGGERASALAIASLSRLSRPIGGVDQVADALEAANEAILAAGRDDADIAGLGTTIAGVVVRDRDVVAFNLGDSRVYRVRQGACEQLSTDHSLVAELVRDGELTAADARRDRRRNVVTRALGIDSAVDMDHRVVDAVEGERFLVCSDGLSNELDDDALVELSSGEGSLDELARSLVDGALEAGGRDNVTAVLMEIVSVATTDDDLEADTNPNTHASAGTSVDAGGQSEVAVAPAQEVAP